MTLLSGGNPRIAKRDGDAPVKVYLAEIPGWNRDGRRRFTIHVYENESLDEERASDWIRQASELPGERLL